MERKPEVLQIVEEPFTVPSKVGRGHELIKCSDGEYYRWDELAERIGLAKNSVYSRYWCLKKKHGTNAWKHMGDLVRTR